MKLQAEDAVGIGTGAAQAVVLIGVAGLRGWVLLRVWILLIVIEGAGLAIAWYVKRRRRLMG